MDGAAQEGGGLFNQDEQYQPLHWFSIGFCVKMRQEWVCVWQGCVCSSGCVCVLSTVGYILRVAAGLVLFPSWYTPFFFFFFFPSDLHTLSWAPC